MSINISDDICDYMINTLAGFQEIVLKFPSSHWVGGWLYRGQSDESWGLLPKAGRAPYNDSPRYDHRFLAWCREAVTYVKNFPENDWERLALAQHHGLATNLLDWTGNPLISAYYACCEFEDKNGVIYCYFPTQYITEPELQTFDDYNKVVAYQPRKLTARIINQNGCFTYHPDAQISISNRLLDEPFYCQQLKKIVIERSSKSQIIDELNLYGINRKTLFPDLDGLSSYINRVTHKK